MAARLLSCYSSGDRRFSALFARLPTGYVGETSRTIEQVYQGAKRDWRGQPFAQPKGIRPALLWIERGLYVCSNGFRHAFYTSLWDFYFHEHPDLFAEACTYDGFYEREGSEEVFWVEEGKTFGEGKPSLFENERACNQALSIAYLVYHRHTPRHLLYPLTIFQAMSNAWKRVHADIPVPWEPGD
jgi:hypothetical protein